MALARVPCSLPAPLATGSTGWALPVGPTWVPGHVRDRVAVDEAPEAAGGGDERRRDVWVGASESSHRKGS